MQDTYSTPPWLLKASGALVGVVILLAIARSISSAGGGAGTPTVQPTPSPTLTSCSSARNEIAATQDLIRRAKFGLAADMASQTVSTQGEEICEQARITLASLAYNATVSDILSTQASNLGRQDLLHWQMVERQATAAGVPESQRMAPIAVMTQAWNIGKWWLARGAFLKAWDDGLVDHRDLSAVEKYYALMRNLGVNLVERAGPDGRPQGLMVLRTALEISRGFDLQRLEAAEDLRKYIGPDPNGWPPPAGDDPVLLAVGAR